MKQRGAHPDKALTAVRIRSITEPGRYADGNGLYLLVDSRGAKRWVLRTVVKGIRRDIGLGSVRLVSLAEAREKATEFRKLAREGGDPLARRRREKALQMTFDEAARKVHEGRKDAWSNPKHRDQWINTLTAYASPHFGSKSIAEIGSPDVLKALSPIWQAKPETAKRVAQRISTVMDWAKAAGYFVGDNPVEGALIGLPKRNDRVEHHAAMPYADVPGFILKLRDADAGLGAKLALELLILTACRTSEILKADPAEFDLEKREWTIPASRMKAKRPHRVPLSDRCIEIIKAAGKLPQTEGLLFAGRTKDAPMSDMTLLMIMRRMGLSYTVHGFRSAFRTWAAEQTNFPREVCEAALAHTLKDKVEASYQRGDMFARRRDLMEAWASFALSVGAR